MGGNSQEAAGRSNDLSCPLFGLRFFVLVCAQSVLQLGKKPSKAQEHNYMQQSELPCR